MCPIMHANCKIIRIILYTKMPKLGDSLKLHCDSFAMNAMPTMLNMKVQAIYMVEYTTDKSLREN